MPRIVRRPISINADIETQQVLKRYRELREWRQHAEAEMKQITEKLAALMREHDSDELQHDRLPVARLTEYALDTVDSKELRQRHPRIYRRFVKTTPVTRVDVL